MRDQVIQNSGSSSLIQSSWLEVVNFLSQKITATSQNILTVYVVGSVVRGKAINQSSDLDLVVLSERPGDLSSLIADLIKNAAEKYDFVHHLDIDVINLQQLLTDQKYFIKRFVLKTQSALIFGEDIREQIPEYKINATLAKQLLENFDDVIAKRLKRIAAADSPALQKEQCKFAMKELIRAAYFLTIPVLFEFTNEKLEMLNKIPQAFPEFSNDCMAIQAFYTNPIDDSAIFQKFYLDFTEKLKKKISLL